MDDPRIQPDPFDLLGLPARFDLDPAEIAQAHRRHIAQAHPDQNRQGSPADADGARQASLINDARAALENEEARAGLLLSRLGGPAASEDKSLPDGFLMEIMETRMAVEEALASGDPRARQRCEDDAEAQRARIIAEVSEAFGRLAEDADPSPAKLAEIRTTLNAWRYFERLIEQLDPDYDPAVADFQNR